MSDYYEEEEEGFEDEENDDSFGRWDGPDDNAVLPDAVDPGDAMNRTIFGVEELDDEW